MMREFKSTENSFETMVTEFAFIIPKKTEKFLIAVAFNIIGHIVFISSYDYIDVCNSRF